MSNRQGPYFIDTVPRVALFVFQALLPLFALALTVLIFGNLFAIVVNNSLIDSIKIGLTFGLGMEGAEELGAKRFLIWLLSGAQYSIILLLVYQMLSFVFALPTVLSFRIIERTEGYFVIDRTGFLAPWKKRALRGTLTYGVFYVMLGSLAKSSGGRVFFFLSVLCFTYFLANMIFLDIHPRYRALHDWILGLWKVKIDDASPKQIELRQPYQLSTIQKYDLVTDNLI